MEQIKSLLDSLNISYNFISDIVFEIYDTGKFIFIKSKNGKVIDEEFQIILDDEEFEFISDVDLDIKYFAFVFGGKLYYSEIGEELTLNKLQYLGKSIFHFETNFPYLGIHTGYEIGAAIGMPEQYIKKAKFLGYETIGICQKTTLNGIIDFQQHCKKNKIKSILGIQIFVEQYEILLYAKNEIGWQNIMNIHSQFSVLKKQTIDIDYLLIEKSEGVICILSNGYDFSNIDKYIKTFNDDLYYKIDLVEWKNNERDKKHLINIQTYYEKYSNKINPCIICESFYIEKNQSQIKKFLNSVLKLNLFDSDNQYFKSLDVIQSEFIKLFKDKEKGKNEFDKAFQHTCEINEKCSFEIATGKKYLPKYEMNEDERKIFKTNDDLFWDLIYKSFDVKLKDVENFDPYLERIQMEYTVLSKGGVVDYFLILHDVCRWMKSQNIQYGVGRGSAAGALTSYLLDITKILDPIKYNLLFERFLNESRLASSLPDIDIDIQGDYREDVKQFIRDKYGKFRVAEVGTYQNFKLKSCLTDTLKHFGVEHSKLKFMTSLITKEYESGNITDLFKVALKEKIILETIQNYPDVVEYLEAILFHPRSRGVHASATIIVPINENQKTFFDWAPTELLDDNLVTQWDSVRLEEIGYLKEDLLGLGQLDKFADIKKLIKKNYNTDIVIDDIPLDDKLVYEFFHEGLNEDIFQFTSDSQKQYTQYLKPDNIEELIAANALYRPGPMDTGAHIKFVKMKFGEEKPDVLPNLEEIIGYTGYLFIYQEQSMLAYQKMSNCLLKEADDFRKFITKLKGDNQSDQKYKMHEEIFIKGYERNFGVEKEVAQEVWDKLVGFATYGFNRSHAAAYAITGYIAQWFKVYYPLEFWVASLNRVHETEDLSKRMNEINKLKVVNVLPPDINFSVENFSYDDKNNIYWSITSIKQAGEKSVEKLFNERQVNGKFRSFNDFWERCGKTKVVNKAVIRNLILCGCFDVIENIKFPIDRLKIISKFEIFAKEKYELYHTEKYNNNFVWQLETKNICSFDDIDYRKIIVNTVFVNSPLNFFDYERIKTYEGSSKNNHVLTAGIIMEITKRKTKKGVSKNIVTVKIDQNNNYFYCIIWEDEKQYHKLFDDSVIGRIMFMSGRCAEDTYRKSNSIYSIDKTKIQIL